MLGGAAKTPSVSHRQDIQGTKGGRPDSQGLCEVPLHASISVQAEGRGHSETQLPGRKALSSYFSFSVQEEFQNKACEPERETCHFYPSTEGSGVRGHPWLHSKSEATWLLQTPPQGKVRVG